MNSSLPSSQDEFATWCLSEFVRIIPLQRKDRVRLESAFQSDGKLTPEIFDKALPDFPQQVTVAQLGAVRKLSGWHHLFKSENPFLSTYLQAVHRVRRLSRSRDTIVLMMFPRSMLLAVHPLRPTLSAFENSPSNKPIASIVMHSLDIRLTLETVTSMRDDGFFDDYGARVSV